MTGSRFIHEAFLGFTESELKSLIAVAFLRLDLGDEARPRFDDGARNRFARLIENVRHPDFFSKNTWHGPEVVRSFDRSLQLKSRRFVALRAPPSGVYKVGL